MHESRDGGERWNAGEERWNRDFLSPKHSEHYMFSNGSLSLIQFKLLFWELENCVKAFKNWWPRLLTAGYIKKQWLETKVIAERPVKSSFKPSRKGPLARRSSDGRSGVRLWVIQDGEKIINMYNSWQFFLLNHKQEAEAMDFNLMGLKYN